MITPSVSTSPTNTLNFGEINYTEFQSTVSTISSASVNDYLESERPEVVRKDHSSLDVIITLPQSAPVTGGLFIKPTNRRRSISNREMQCSSCSAKRRENTRTMGLDLSHCRALWPLGVSPHTFATIHSADAWTALVQSSKDNSNNNDIYGPKARRCLSSNRIALLQQLFAFDIKPFCSY